MFDSASSVVISGGQVNDIRGNQINYITNVQVVLNEDKASTSSAPTNRSVPHVQEKFPPLAQIAPGLASATGATPQFVQVELLLQTIIHLLDVLPPSLSSSLRSSSMELWTTVAFCKRAHFASRTMPVYPFLKREVTKRLERCTETLLRAHKRITKLPYTLIPNWLDVGRLFLSWLVASGREPEDILSIRLEIIAEIELLGDYLGCLKSSPSPRFAWATGRWSSVACNNEFTIYDLAEFFASGPPSLKSLRVEEVIVIEPLGQALSVPLPLDLTTNGSSIHKDVHELLKLGCYGTQGNFFIENRHYQLDNPATNRTMTRRNANQNLTHGTILEVTILAQTRGSISPRCPRCGERGESLHEWIHCQGCRATFKIANGREDGEDFISPGARFYPPLPRYLDLLGKKTESKKVKEGNVNRQNAQDPNVAASLFRRIKVRVSNYEEWLEEIWENSIEEDDLAGHSETLDEVRRIMSAPLKGFPESFTSLLPSANLDPTATSHSLHCGE
ncbi:hypothetical protein BKA70DRAFT_1228592 [Coprinopsis sp. MPI-PUGE-AT-0042]|nr:hypothetical protein BKA70DRAFT_1228592 [Coprinopsis sp. MPI-PUGE-AT-0042]